MKRLLFLLSTIITLVSLQSCEVIDAGHVGIKVNKTGDNQGVQDIVQVTGWAWYNPVTSIIFEFPTYVQHVDYEPFEVGAKDAALFSIKPSLNYSVLPGKVPYIFVKYRKPLRDIEQQFIRTTLFEAYKISANRYTSDSLLKSREIFENNVRKILVDSLGKDGFILNQLTCNISIPKSLQESIERKNNSVQKAMQVENEIKTADAQARIAIAQANGQAQAALIAAKAEAEVNRLRQQSLTPLLIQQQYIDKWDGVLPTYGQVPSLMKQIQ
jgi:regulator of protease activity HflC (stomatin/prohibitin superfamily)